MCQKELRTHHIFSWLDCHNYYRLRNWLCFFLLQLIKRGEKIKVQFKNAVQVPSAIQSKGLEVPIRLDFSPLGLANLSIFHHKKCGDEMFYRREWIAGKHLCLEIPIVLGKIAFLMLNISLAKVLEEGEDPLDWCGQEGQKTLEAG